jgi:hypothetical protein
MIDPPLTLAEQSALDEIVFHLTPEKTLAQDRKAPRHLSRASAPASEKRPSKARQAAAADGLGGHETHFKRRTS